MTSATKDAVAHALRAFSAIFHRNAWPIESQRPLAWSMRAICACRSPHRAPNRLVQSAFRIGVPMRKALSIIQPSRRNGMAYKVISRAVKLCRLVSRHTELLYLRRVAAAGTFPIIQPSRVTAGVAVTWFRRVNFPIDDCVRALSEPIPAKRLLLCTTALAPTARA